MNMAFAVRIEPIYIHRKLKKTSQDYINTDSNTGSARKKETLGLRKESHLYYKGD